ncbi:MAG: tRNA-2-methylthio-N6-dimethylallyladenosine synthase [Solirubrobacteraceae bacterium]|jgi:tRNA-2-methylthio-N6-dimethylallyladenosine synthase|nr:tRNA-2-methylthio-N6-dimethylallyladenosine synthase [Solirubrobacteraceae bacterium]
MPGYHVTTFGCQMNEHDSERMKGMLESIGYEERGERAEADLILFNTCSIREKADERFVAHLQEARAVKRRRPETVIGVGGCWAQSVKDEVFRRFPFVDVAFGPGQVHKLAEFLTSDSLTAQGYFEFEGFTGRLPEKRARDFQGWLQISVGCRMRCSYCIVPSTRGHEVSRPAVELLAAVERMATEGVREVTLLGQNVNSYGRDLPASERVAFAELLRAVDAVEGIERIRYTSPHPQYIGPDVARAHAECESVCEHIHLPLQAGSSRVLKAMRRTYTRERFLDRVRMIRSHVPDVALTTDVIVGFPGESESEFAETLEVVDEVGFDGAFTFIYSPRRGTEASQLGGRIAHDVAVERMERLVEVVQRRARERAQRFVGRTLEVLVEGPSRTDPARLRGRTRHNKVVNFSGSANPGEFVDVRVESATSQTLSGVAADERSIAGGRAQPAYSVQ